MRACGPKKTGFPPGHSPACDRSPVARARRPVRRRGGSAGAPIFDAGEVCSYRSGGSLSGYGYGYASVSLRFLSSSAFRFLQTTGDALPDRFICWFARSAGRRLARSPRASTSPLSGHRAPTKSTLSFVAAPQISTNGKHCTRTSVFDRSPLVSPP